MTEGENCRKGFTCTIIHASLPYRGLFHSQLDLQCLQKGQVHLPAQGQVFPSALLANGTRVETNTTPKENSYKARQVSTSPLSLPLHHDTGHILMAGDASSAGTQKGKTNGAEPHRQPAHNLKGKIHLHGCKPLRPES